MKIGGTEYGYRSTRDGIVDAPSRWHSVGISLAGDVTATDFGTKVCEVPVLFQMLTESEKNTLKGYLMDTIKPGNYVTVNPDTGDDLQIGASATASLVFTTFQAMYICPDRWDVNIGFVHYSGSLV